MKFFVLSLLVLLGTSGSVFAKNYDYLSRLETKLPVVPEKTTPRAGFRSERPLALDMTGFYEELESDGEVNIFVGYGAEWYSPDRIKETFTMVQKVSQEQGLGFSDFNFDQTKEVFSFSRGNVKFTIQGGHTREAYLAALAKYDVVMYNGHSRYGRGPAFEEMSNYVRIGDEYPEIEVDVRNRYFRDESILKTSEFPLLDITLDNILCKYQYRGEKSEESHLPSDAYTKVIEGGDKDLRNAEFIDGKQIIWLHSCSNEGHWKNSVRKVLTDPKEKAVFGTVYDAYGSLQADSVFISMVAANKPTSTDILTELNKIQSTCSGAPCYTSY